MGEKNNAERIISGTFYGYHPSSFLSVLDKILAKGDRVELIPVKDGVKVIQIKRKEIKTEQ